MENIAARALLALIWLLHWLPLGLQAVLGRGPGQRRHVLAEVDGQVIEAAELVRRDGATGHLAQYLGAHGGQAAAGLGPLRLVEQVARA